MKAIASFLYFKVWRWKLKNNITELDKKAVIIFAPHTSNWDFVIGRVVLKILNYNPKLLVKSSLFFFPLGSIIRLFGGIPVERSKKNNLINQVVDIFNKTDSVYIIFTPEGTRSRRDNWKTGFYYAAYNANVPIYISFGDYKKKEAGLLGKFYPTGDIEKDMPEIKKLYYNITGKHPDKGVFPNTQV